MLTLNRAISGPNTLGFLFNQFRSMQSLTRQRSGPGLRRLLSRALGTLSASSSSLPPFCHEILQCLHVRLSWVWITPGTSLGCQAAARGWAVGHSACPSDESPCQGHVTAKGSSYKPGASSPPARKLRALKGGHEGLTGCTHTANNAAVCGWDEGSHLSRGHVAALGELCRASPHKAVPQPRHRATLLGQKRVPGSKRRCDAYQKLNYSLIWGEIQNNFLADRPLCYSILWNISITVLSFPAGIIAEVPAVM